MAHQVVGGELYGTIRSLSRSVVRRERMSIDLSQQSRHDRVDSFGHVNPRDTLHSTCLQLSQVKELVMKSPLIPIVPTLT
jgi:hypothetical protein